MYLNKLCLLLILSVFLFISPVLSQTEKPILSLKILNKITGRVHEVSVVVGGMLQLGNLTVLVQACRMNHPEDFPETVAYIQLNEKRNSQKDQIFSGWLFASSPSLNGVEHSVFDLWPVACKTASGEAFTGKE